MGEALNDLPRIAVSTFGWPEGSVALNHKAYTELQGLGVRGLEVAPGFLGQQIVEHHDLQAITELKSVLADHGLKIAAIQSLLHGTTGLQIFTAPRQTFDRLEHMLRLAGILRDPAETTFPVVFGSPRNRTIPADRDRAKALCEAAAFFARLGKIADSEGVSFCLEPAAAIYGTNLGNTVDEVASLIAGNVGLGLMLDTGSMSSNQEEPSTTIRRIAKTGNLRHVHHSEPMLTPVTAGSVVNHRTVGQALQQAGYHGWITLEMLKASDDNLPDSEQYGVTSLEQLKTGLLYLTSIYLRQR